jgi:hypothetical protein
MVQGFLGIVRMTDPYARPIDLRDLGYRRIEPSWIDKADTSAWQWLLDLADQAESTVRGAFMAAVDWARGKVDPKSLERAVENRNAEDIARIVTGSAALAAALITGDYKRQLEDVYIAAGRRTSATLASSFDIRNPRSTDFLERYDLRNGATGIRQVTADQATAVRDIVTGAFQQGGHPVEQARMIRNIVGLLPRQAQAVVNYRDALTQEGRASDQLNRMVDRYQGKLLNRRAQTIARTETIRAANAGQQAAWRQAADDQLLNRVTARQQWIVTPDDRLCPFCAAVPDLNPDGVELDGTFESELGPVEGPPLHPNCRCALTLAAY